MFSSGSLSSISLATVTPSFVIVAERNLDRVRKQVHTAQNGLPGFFAMDNLFCHPFLLFLSGGFAGGCENSENFVFAKNQVFVIVHFDFRTGVLSEKNPIPFLHFERNHFPIFQPLSAAHSNNLALLGFLFRCVRDDDPATHGFLFFDPLNQNTIMQRSYSHGLLSFCPFV
jgi:hypothetical protein